MNITRRNLFRLLGNNTKGRQRITAAAILLSKAGGILIVSLSGSFIRRPKFVTTNADFLRADFRKRQSALNQLYLRS